MSQIPAGVIPRWHLEKIAQQATTLMLVAHNSPTEIPNEKTARRLSAELAEGVEACVILLKPESIEHALLRSLQTHLASFPSNPSPQELHTWLVTISTAGSAVQCVLKRAPQHPLLERLFFPPPVQLESAGRLYLRRSPRTIVLDGRSYPIENPVAFRLFEALFKADREGRTPISRPGLARAAGISGDDVRPNRLFRHLPIRIRVIIKSQAGKRGGYCLLLPSLPQG